MDSMNVQNGSYIGHETSSSSPLNQKAGNLNGHHVALLLAVYSEGSSRSDTSIQGTITAIREIVSETIQIENLSNFQQLSKYDAEKHAKLEEAGYTKIHGTNCYVKDIKRAIENLSKDTGISSYSKKDMVRMQKMMENVGRIGNPEKIGTASNSSLRDFVPKPTQNFGSLAASFITEKVKNPIKDFIDSTASIAQSRTKATDSFTAPKPKESEKSDRSKFRGEGIKSFGNSLLQTLNQFAKPIFGLFTDEFKPEKSKKSKNETENTQTKVKKESLQEVCSDKKEFRLDVENKPTPSNDPMDRSLDYWKKIDIKEQPKGISSNKISFDFNSLKASNFRDLEDTFKNLYKKEKHGALSVESDLISSISHLKGIRNREMEDTHFMGMLKIGDKEATYTGICDGHDGIGSSHFIRDHFNKIVQNHFVQCLGDSKSLDLKEMENACATIGESLNNALLELRNDIDRGNRALNQTMSAMEGRDPLEDSVERDKLSRSIRNQASLLRDDNFIRNFTKIEKKANQEELKDIQKTYGDMNKNLEYQRGGSTMTVAIRLENSIWAVNVGDSRILALNGSKIDQLTEDASPDNPFFAKGVADLGGQVTKDGKRVLLMNNMPMAGGLSVARAIGDHDYKAISSKAEVTKYDIHGPMHLVLGCDGIFERLTSEQVGIFAQTRLKEGSPLETISNDLVKLAFASGSTDNISAIIMKI
ncbi:MAG: PP2C family protein-serine/threonine phosphatase [Chlamydia sp.]